VIRRGGRGSRPSRAAAAPAAAWDPLRELAGLKDRLNRVFESTLRHGGVAADEAGLAGWAPAADLREESGAYVLTAEVPGVPRSSLKLRVEPGRLVLEGERPQAPEMRRGEPLRVERSYGRFLRSFRLPGGVDERGAVARLEQGVLEVRLPKSDHGRAAAVPIRVR
jgi:HSP20 family protein